MKKRQTNIFESLEPRQLLTTFNPHDGNSLVQILNGTNSGTKLALGDTVILDAGVNYQSTTFSPFTLKNITQKNTDPVNDGWITIKSSALAQLPAGKRVSYTDGQYMPKLWAAGNNVPAVNTQAGAHHFKFQGVEFVGFMQMTKDLTNTSLFTILDIGDSSSTQTTVALEPHDIVFDRAYVHPEYITVDYAVTHNGTPRDSDAYLPNTYSDLMVRKGISLHAANVDITNSYFREIHEGSDSNAIYAVNGSGPYNIINNHLEGAGENVLFGGSDGYMKEMDGHGVFRGNHVMKPLDWRNGTNGSRAWTVKNLFELKEGSHIVIEDNIFENSWVSGQDGVAILFKLGNYEMSGNPKILSTEVPQGTALNSRRYNVDEDIIFRNNIVRHAARGITFQGRDYDADDRYNASGGNPVDPGGLVRRFKIENNLWNDIGSKDGAGNAIWGGVSPFAYLVHGPKDVQFRHNTIMAGYTPLEMDTNLTTWSSPNFVFTDNVVNMNDYGIRGSGGSGDTGIKLYLPDSLFKGNVFVDNLNNSPAGNYDNVSPASWPGNKYSPTRVRFVNFWEPQGFSTTGFVNPAGGNYRLTNPNKYITGVTTTDTLDGNIQVTAKTTDLTAPGANFDVVDGRTAGVVSGIWQFAYVVGSQLFLHFDGSATPISLSLSGSNLVVTQTGQTTLTVPASSITGINVVDSTGDDTLQVSGALSAALLQPTNTSGNDLLTLSGGNFAFGSDLSTFTQYWEVPNWGVHVAAGATATFNSTQHLRSLSVDGTATIAASGSRVLSVKDLQVTGKLDLADNSLVWDYSDGTPIGAWTGGNVYNGLTGLIAAGRNNGAWNGNGVITTRPNAAGATAKTTLGVAEAATVLAYTNGSATFSGQTIDNTAVLVKYTWNGDANLSGKIDGDDFFRIDSGFSAQTKAWSAGDFDLGGGVNADDYWLIDSIFNKSGGVLT
jgi:hypothetical protein